MSGFLRARQISELVGLSLSTLWRLERKGQFPKRFLLTENSVAWSRDEVEAWCKSRPRGGPKVPVCQKASAKRKG